MNFLDDSVWFCMEKLKKHSFETKNKNKTKMFQKFKNDSAWFCIEKLKNTVLRPKKIKNIKEGYVNPDDFCVWDSDCNLRQGAGGMKIARLGSRTWFLR